MENHFQTFLIGFAALISAQVFAQDFESSNLPLIVINTNGQVIVDEPDIVAGMVVIDNGIGNLHTLDDVPTYVGDINIEKRGSSSLDFEKNNYALETVDALGADLDTNLFGFGKEEDWILHGPWADKSLLRNTLSMKIFREMGHYSSRTQFCELFINDEYRGVYVFMEKIKRDDDRVDIAKLTPQDISGDDVTGGYIIKFDWPEGDGWNSQFTSVGGESQYFQYFYPKQDQIQPEQKDYIEAFVDSFELALFSDNFENQWGVRYDSYIDIYSFIDQFLINELAKEVDGYKLSTFMHKDKFSNDPRLKAGPVWDYNIAWFNSDYCSGGNEQGWLFNEMNCEDLELMPRWWERFWEDEYFRNALNCRWNDLKGNVLSEGYLHAYIDEHQALLTEAAGRNYEKWDILDEYTWDHPIEPPGSWQGEIEVLKEWISDRLAWMDANMPGNCALTLEDVDSLEWEMYPNPATEEVVFQLPTRTSSIQIYDARGTLVISESNLISSRILLEVSDLAPGMFIVNVMSRNGYSSKKLVVE